MENVNNFKPGHRLFKYAWIFKKTIFYLELVSFFLFILALLSCSKEDEVVLNSTANQISFKMNGEVTTCYGDFYWNGDVFTGRFENSQIEDGIMAIDVAQFAVVGEYIIDSVMANSSNVLTVWSGGVATFSTFLGFLSENQGSGKIAVEEVTDQHIEGSFEGVLDDLFGRSVIITDGWFQVRREE